MTGKPETSLCLRSVQTAYEDLAMPPRRRQDVQSQGWQQWWVLAPARELDPVIPVCVAGRPSQYSASAYFRRKFVALFRESSPKCFSQRRPPARYCQECGQAKSSQRWTRSGRHRFAAVCSTMRAWPLQFNLSTDSELLAGTGEELWVPACRLARTRLRSEESEGSRGEPLCSTACRQRNPQGLS
eukprot:s3844_g2.t1